MQIHQHQGKQIQGSTLFLKNIGNDYMNPDPALALGYKMDSSGVKNESVSDLERFEEIRRLRRQCEETDRALAALTAPTNDAEELARMASRGKYICVEMGSDDEEMITVVDGDPRVIDLVPRVVKSEPGDCTAEVNNAVEEAESGIGDMGVVLSKEEKTRMKRLKRKARRNITPEFVNVSFSFGILHDFCSSRLRLFSRGVFGDTQDYGHQSRKNFRVGESH